jgi:ribosomal protein S11
LRKTFTNFVVTITDLFGKVFYCATSYSSLEEKKKDKKRRLSVFAIEDIVFKILPPMVFSDMSHVILVSRVKTRAIIFSMCRKLRFYGFKVFGLIRESVNPHNGVRARKEKRR